MAALAYAEQGQIPTVYATLGYYDGGGIWDNTPPAVSRLQQFLDEVTTQRQNASPHLTLPRLVVPSWNKSRKEWVAEQIKLGMPYQYTWSCWFFDGWSPGDRVDFQENTLPCGECKCCQSRKLVLQHAEVMDHFHYDD